LSLSDRIQNILRTIIEESWMILDKAITFSKDYLSWEPSPKKKIAIRLVDRDEWTKCWKDDLLAHEVEGTILDPDSDKPCEAHIIDINVEKLHESKKDEEFVANFTYVLIHEILEIYKKQTGISHVHEEGKPNEPTPFELEMWKRFLEKEFDIPRSILEPYKWKTS